jgi:hypothetical protein
MEIHKMKEYQEFRKELEDHYDSYDTFHNFIGTLPLKIGASIIGGLLLIGGIGELIEHSKNKKQDIEKKTQNEIVIDKAKINLTDYQTYPNY